MPGVAEAGRGMVWYGMVLAPRVRRAGTYGTDEGRAARARERLLYIYTIRWGPASRSRSRAAEMSYITTGFVTAV